MLFVNMSASQFEELTELLNKIYNSITGILVLTSFLWLTTIAIFLVVFFAYYDKEQDRKRKDEDARIKRIVEESKRDDSKV